MAEFGDTLTPLEAPKQPVDAVYRVGVAQRVAKLYQNPSLIEGVPDNRPNFSAFQEKQASPNSTYSPEETLYREKGWKAYVRETGDRGFRLEDIAKAEQLTSHDIRDSIEDGTITDPNAIRLWAQMQLDEMQVWANRILADYQSTPALQPFLEYMRGDVSRRLRETAQECIPLLHATTEQLTRYCVRQAGEAIREVELYEKELPNNVQNTETVTDIGNDAVSTETWRNLVSWYQQGLTEKPQKSPSISYGHAAEHWYNMAARLAKQREVPLPEPEETSQNPHPVEVRKAIWEKYHTLSSYEIGTAITTGAITDPDIFPLYAQKVRDENEELLAKISKGDNLPDIAKDRIESLRRETQENYIYFSSSMYGNIHNCELVADILLAFASISHNESLKISASNLYAMAARLVGRWIKERKQKPPSIPEQRM